MTTTVLLVEGCENYREFVTSFFKQRDFDVQGVCSYDEARQALNAKHFDIIITDFFCNGVDGEDFCTWVQLSNHQPTGLIIMSHKQSSSIEKRVRLLAPAFYFIKPFSIDNLYAVVLRICGFVKKMEHLSHKPLQSFISYPCSYERVL